MTFDHNGSTAQSIGTGPSHICSSIGSQWMYAVRQIFRDVCGAVRQSTSTKMQRSWLHGLRALAVERSAAASGTSAVSGSSANHARRWVSSSTSRLAPSSSASTDPKLNDAPATRRGPFQRRTNSVPVISAARVVSNMHQKPGRKPSVREKAEVTAQLDELVARAASGKHFEPNLDFLRNASRVLQLCKSREQLVTALPLCEIVESSKVVHGTATMECVRIYQRLGRNREVVELAERLFKNDFFLMNPVLSNAIQACSALGNVNKGFELFETAMERGTIPNLNVYSALLSLCGAAGDTTRVQVVLDKMKAAGLEMNHITFHNLMSAYSKGGHMDKAIELFHNLPEYGLTPDDHTYAILMDAYGENGDYETALKLMEDLKASTTMTPNLVHYNVILKACGKASKLTMAFQLYEEMKERKIQPDLVTYITMMHAVFHGELGEIDTKKVKAALAGVGAMGVAFVPFIDFQEYYLTVLFCGSMLGSMGLAAYMNPDGVLRALYPNSDEPQNDTIIEAFFRRLREEDHCGRSMYLWREMLKFSIPADPRVYDVLVRTCVKKRHPEMAFEAVFEEHLPLTDSEGNFVLPLQTTVQFLHSLLAQRRVKMADTLFTAGVEHGAFADVFVETKNRHVYDLRSFGTGQVRSYTISKALSQLRAHVAAESKIVDDVNVPDVDFLVLHGYDLLDQLDADYPSVRELFSMDEMKREAAGSNPGQYFFRLTVAGEKLKEYFATTKEAPEQQNL
ncbi:Ppr repeat protein, partial [Globisporangium splendens]